ncbi:MAG TPA: helix-turn-helix domain-containing protein [Gemmatimonadaceae bacterium]|nr:helix-turn-helix domain-containing protein [Gemmatimonadaceae bacterium]
MTRDVRRSGCPIGIALDLFGDRWSLLVVRDLLFKDRRTFGEFADSGEGIATNVLADRLSRLELAGIVERRADAADGRRAVYHLTEKGFALAPVLVEMVIWAARHEDTDAPPAEVREMERHRARFMASLRKRWSRR